MGRLAVIAPFHGRHERTADLLRRVLVESTRPPDEFWLIVEDEFDARAVDEASWWDPLIPYHAPIVLPTPRKEDGSVAIIPYSNKINYALDRLDADYIVYLDNGSMPAIEKYDVMTQALAANPDWGSVYCGQERTGYQPKTAHADQVHDDGFAILNFTQVCHRPTADRWTLNLADANPDLADAIFWRDIRRTLGPFHPVAPGIILDEHHIPNEKAAGI